MSYHLDGGASAGLQLDRVSVKKLRELHRRFSQRLPDELEAQVYAERVRAIEAELEKRGKEL